MFTCFSFAYYVQQMWNAERIRLSNNVTLSEQSFDCVRNRQRTNITGPARERRQNDPINIFTSHQMIRFVLFSSTFMLPKTRKTTKKKKCIREWKKEEN